MVQTYRLFEWAHFLQRAGELPNNAITLPETIDVSVYKNTQTNAMLSLVEFINLQSLYSDSNLHSQLKREIIKFDKYT